MTDEELLAAMETIIKTEITSALLAFGLKPKSLTPDADRMRLYRQKKKNDNVTQPNAKRTRTPHKANGGVTLGNETVTRIGFDFGTMKFTGITEDKELKWQDAYPAIPIPPAIDQAAAWLVANPANKKSNYERFLVNWFTRAQDKAGRVRH